MLEKLIQASAIVNSKDLGRFKHVDELPQHNWYGYTEGYSSQLVTTLLDFHSDDIRSVLDPFSGSGTTALEASVRGLKFTGYDINPAINLVADVKVNTSWKLAKRMSSDKSYENYLYRTLQKLVEKMKQRKGISPNYPFHKRDYFNRVNLLEVCAAIEFIDQLPDMLERGFFKLALLSEIVSVSNLKRSPDLKYKSESMMVPRASNRLFETISKMIGDLVSLSASKYLRTSAKADFITQSASEMNKKNVKECDLIITSPPYLNGTNYIRNTKLELWASGFLSDESDLKNYNKKCLTCSINSIQGEYSSKTPWTSVTRTIQQVASKSYDSRIEPMVSGYFFDMADVISGMFKTLRSGGSAYIIIGDSAFNGVHVPTHEHLKTIAKDVGFKVGKSIHLRDRRSRGGMPLIEEIICMVK